MGNPIKKVNFHQINLGIFRLVFNQMPENYVEVVYQEPLKGDSKRRATKIGHNCVYVEMTGKCGRFELWANCKDLDEAVTIANQQLDLWSRL